MQNLSSLNKAHTCVNYIVSTFFLIFLSTHRHIDSQTTPLTTDTYSHNLVSSKRRVVEIDERRTIRLDLNCKTHSNFFKWSTNDFFEFLKLPTRRDETNGHRKLVTSLQHMLCHWLHDTVPHDTCHRPSTYAVGDIFSYDCETNMPDGANTNNGHVKLSSWCLVNAATDLIATLRRCDLIGIMSILKFDRILYFILNMFPVLCLWAR